MKEDYRPYSEYRHSGIEWLGVVPRKWVVARLKQYASVTDGSHHSPAIRDSGLPFISVTDVRRDDIDFDGCKRISRTDYERLVREGCQPAPGDILLTKDGTIGRAVVVQREDPPFVVLSSLGLISDLRGMTGRFLRYFLVSGICVDQMNSLIHGSALRRLTIKKISGLRVLIPGRSEQTQIAKFLDYETAKIDGLIEKQEQLIALLEEKRQAVISHAVTKGLNPDAPMRDSGVEWLGEVPAHWEVTRLKRAVEMYGRIGFRGYATSDIVNEGEGAIVLSPSNINERGFSLNKTTFLSWHKYFESPEIMLQPGDIILVKTGWSFGKVAVVRTVESPMTVNPQMLLLKNSKLDPRYVVHFLQTKPLQARISNINSGSYMPTMSQGNVGNLPALAPPAMEVKRIADYVDGITRRFNTLLDKQFEAVLLLRERRSALVSAAVTGKIDVRDWKAPESEVEAA